MRIPVQTYQTKSGRHVGIMPVLGGWWITGYLDRDQHRGRLRCNQVPIAGDPFGAQKNLDAYAGAHGWQRAGHVEVDV